MGGVAPIPLRFVLACCPRARSVLRPCALARVCWSIAVPAGAGGRGPGGGPRCPPPPPLAPRSFQGGGKTVPSALGGVRARRPRGPRVGGGYWGDRGEGRAVVLRLPPQTPLRRRRIPPQCTCLAWVVGQPREPGAACRRRVSLVGGGGGGAACAPPSPKGLPGGLAGQGVALPRSVPLPSLGGQQTGRHWRRSGIGGLGLHTAPVRVRVPPPGTVRAPFL